MEYTVKKLANISGVSPRTLRYYDQIDLLKPARVSSNGYRIYGSNEVDILQQILFYRELGVSLDEIKTLLAAPDYDKEESLQSHLTALLQKKIQIEILIKNVSKTINSMKGVTIMNDEEKFKGLKLIDENEQKYGAEIREKYGDDIVNASNTKIKGMTPEQYTESEELRIEIDKTLKAAFETGDPAGELAQYACELHKQWLSIFYPNYSKEYHMGLGEMYVSDERFTVYYDKLAVGCTKFLRDAINIYCGK